MISNVAWNGQLFQWLSNDYSDCQSLSNVCLTRSLFWNNVYEK
jgi:hypothetical protein